MSTPAASTRSPFIARALGRLQFAGKLDVAADARTEASLDLLELNEARQADDVLARQLHWRLRLKLTAHAPLQLSARRRAELRFINMMIF